MGIEDRGDEVVVEEERETSPATHLGQPTEPAVEFLAGAWAEQDDQTAQEADEEAGGYGEWLLVAAITFVAGVVLMLIIFVLQPAGVSFQHVH